MITASAGESLRDLADAKGILFGAAAGTPFFTADTLLKANLKREFNGLVAEYQMKFGQLQPTRGAYNWTAPDRMLAFADSNGMALRGHCLAWHKEAGWLEAGDFSREDMFAILKDHIHTVVGRYKGRIPQWDVVNEAVSNDPDSLYRDTFLFRKMGSGFIDSCFRWAREADSGAALYYNEYWNEGLGPKSDKTFELVKGMKERGVPIDGVGLQCHFRYDSLPAFEDMDANLKRLAGLGLSAAFTEVDFRIPVPAAPEALEKQAEDYRRTLEVCLANPNCRTFMIWGVSDAYSWIPKSYPGWGAGLILDADYRPKPAYYGLRVALGGEANGILSRGPARPASGFRNFRFGRFGPKWRDALGRAPVPR